MQETTLIDTTKLPQHIAIIMDGNGRWAKEKGEDRIVGHQHGVHSVRDVVEGCGEIGIKYLTLYAFSTENWNRPKYEIDALMELLVSALRNEVPALIKNKVRLHVIGDTQSLAQKCIDELTEAIEMTAEGAGLNWILALSYSARWEIQRAATLIAKDIIAGTLKPEDITQEVVEKNLCTHNFPDPELMIRTGGEHRISNFLLYQMAYTELYFTDTHWPDFRKQHLKEAIINYQKRERRFGKTSEQINPE